MEVEGSSGVSAPPSIFTRSEKMLELSAKNPLLTAERWEELLKQKCCCAWGDHLTVRSCDRGDGHYNEMQKKTVREFLNLPNGGDDSPWVDCEHCCALQR